MVPKLKRIGLVLRLQGKFGGDVFLTLTWPQNHFCIPHGGLVGPGMGPLVFKSTLAPFLTGHDMAVTRKWA